MPTTPTSESRTVPQTASRYIGFVVLIKRCCGSVQLASFAFTSGTNRSPESPFGKYPRVDLAWPENPPEQPPSYRLGRHPYAMPMVFSKESGSNGGGNSVPPNILSIPYLQNRRRSFSNGSKRSVRRIPRLGSSLRRTTASRSTTRCSQRSHAKYNTFLTNWVRGLLLWG